jgi:outer membrane protein OmpA-like peptidoglycan-associated protein
MTRFRTLLLISFLLSIVPPVLSQKPAVLKKKGEDYFGLGRWQESLEQLRQYQAQKPGELDVLTKIGVCQYRLHQGEQALKTLEFVYGKNPSTRDPDLHFYLARTLHGRQEFDRAIAAYKSYLRVALPTHPLRAFSADNILRCMQGKSLPPSETVALVENMGDRINSTGDEFAPIPSINHADRLYFSAAREGCTGGRRNQKGYEDEKNGEWCSDMYLANLGKSGWELAADLGSLLNTPRFEVALGFNSTGQILYFFRGFSLFSGEIFADTATVKDEYAVSQPNLVSPMRPEEGDGAPFFYNDSTLIFASARTGGQGGLDLYWAVFVGGSWTEPRNFGPAINSAYDETTPFLSADGRTLYFSSNHNGSMGGFDVYKSVFDVEKQAWQTPQNMGIPVNSPGDDAFFRLAPDGSTAFFSSDRLDSYGERDVYIAYFKEPQAEQLAENASVWFNAGTLIPNTGDTGLPADAQPENAALPVLFYNNDRDVLSPENLKILDESARLARNMPGANVLVTVHTDETGQSKFDLYYGIKRAEPVGKALAERGVPAGKILLRSCGPNYPIARNVIDAAPNPEGQRLNRRIEITLVSAGNPLPIEVVVARPQVSELMATGNLARLDDLTKGLSYKVEVASVRQLLNNDALSMFSDILIESQPGSGLYRYTAGYFKQFNQASKLRQELQKQGFEEAGVVAYLNGVRISKAEAVSLVKKHPDLAAFVKG